MSLTKLGRFRQWYADNIEPRPYSRFTQDTDEQQANKDYYTRVDALFAISDTWVKVEESK